MAFRTVKALSTSFAQECLLLTAIWHMFAMLGNFAERIYFVLAVLGCGFFVLVFTRPVVDFNLWLSLDKSSFVLA